MITHHPADYVEKLVCRDLPYWQCPAFPQCCTPACMAFPECVEWETVLVEAYDTIESRCDLSLQDLFALLTLRNIPFLPPGFPCSQFIAIWKAEIELTADPDPLPSHVLALLDALRDSPLTQGLPWPTVEHLEDIRVARMSSVDKWALGAIPGDRHGITLGNLIILGDDYYAKMMEAFPAYSRSQFECEFNREHPDMQKAFLTLAHELVHSVQYKRDTTEAFCAQVLLAAMTQRDGPLEDEAASAEGTLRSRIADADCEDADGVPDDDDNCPTWRCYGKYLASCYNPHQSAIAFCNALAAKCYNPDQSDEDNDGVGDVCDNCPLDRNHLQLDLDADGAGDECDVCPGFPNYYTQLDGDGDGIPVGCDNCDSTPNGYVSCTTDSDCQTGCPTAYPPRCIRHFDDSPDPGRCSHQLDDLDCDGVGPECDRCEGMNDSALILHSASLDALNSNRVAEDREDAPALDDRCDPVPLYVARPYAPDPVWGDASAPYPNVSNTVLINGWAGIGRDLASLPQYPYDGVAGFGYCSCIDWGSAVLDEESCRQTLCPADRDLYKSPVSTTWKSITLAAMPVGQVPAQSSFGPGFEHDLARGEELARTFTQAIHGWSVGAHETLAWRWWKDLQVNGGPVPALDGRPFGLLWSHTLDGTIASSRDGAYSQGLRDSYTHVEAPLYRLPMPVKQLPEIVDGGLWIVPELWRFRPPAWNLKDSLLGYTDLVSKLVATDSYVALVRDGSAIDVSSLVTTPVRDRLASGLVFLAPAETASEIGVNPEGLIAVGMPVDWRDDSFVMKVVVSASGLEVPTDRIDRDALFSTTEAASAPSARSGALYVLSVRNASLFMAGGRDASGAQAGEVWRYRLDTAQWSLVNTGGIMPDEVLAVGYDARADTLAVVATALPHSKTLRLLAIDVAGGTCRAFEIAMRGKSVKRRAILARGDGSYVLMSARNGSAHLYRFTLSEAGLVWTGRKVVVGKVTGDPVLSTHGITVPVWHAKAHRLVTVTDEDFVPHSGGSEEL